MAGPLAKAARVLVKDVQRSSQASNAFVTEGTEEFLLYDRWLQAMRAQRVAYPYVIIFGRGSYSLALRIPCNYGKECCSTSFFDMDAMGLCPLERHGDVTTNAISDKTFVFLIATAARHHVNVMLYRTTLDEPWTVAFMDPNYNNEDVLDSEMTRSLERTWELLRLLLPDPVSYTHLTLPTKA